MKARHEFDTEEDYHKYLKTHFAAMAMQGLLFGTFKFLEENPMPEPINQILNKEKLAKEASELADALLTQLTSTK